jgi:hypothetical protein
VLCRHALQISVSNSLTKGEASDLISEHKSSLAEPAQLQELQVGTLHPAVHARVVLHLTSDYLHTPVLNMCIFARFVFQGLKFGFKPYTFRINNYGVCACGIAAAASCTAGAGHCSS